jgi:hypothetical protein
MQNAKFRIQTMLERDVCGPVVATYAASAFCNVVVVLGVKVVVQGTGLAPVQCEP